MHSRTDANWIHGPVDTTPENAGFDSSRMERLEEIFESLVASEKAQCAAYCLARGGRVFADRSFGPRHHDDAKPMEPGTWRGIASVTKVLTTMGILKLVEDGRFLMEWPVSKVLTEFDTPSHRGITLWHLLTHTSGVVPDPGSDGEPDPDWNYWDKLQNPGWIAEIASFPLRNEPGRTWRYCSTGFGLVGEMIARIAGESYVAWMEREILAPAGLSETFWDMGARPLDGFAYVSDLNRSKYLDRRARMDKPYMSLGGAFSTCRDMVRLGTLLASGGTIDGVRVLGRKTVEAMTTVQVEVPAPHWGDSFPDWKYGLGLEPARHPLVRPGSTWGHEGSDRCAMWFDKESGLSMAWTLPTTLDWDPDFGWTPRAVLLSGLT